MTIVSSTTLMPFMAQCSRFGVGVAGDRVAGGLALGGRAARHPVDERGRGHTQGHEGQLQPVEAREAEQLRVGVL